MWWLIIVVIFGWSIIKFLKANNEQASSVAKQGGMRKKYRTLVNHFLSGRSDCRVVRETGTSIVVGSSSAGGSTYFDIVQTFGTVTVVWRSSSVMLGKHKIEWEFNEFMDQNDMIKKIDNDTEVYMMNVIQKFM